MITCKKKCGECNRSKAHSTGTIDYADGKIFWVLCVKKRFLNFLRDGVESFYLSLQKLKGGFTKNHRLLYQCFPNKDY